MRNEEWLFGCIAIAAFCLLFVVLCSGVAVGCILWVRWLVGVIV